MHTPEMHAGSCFFPNVIRTGTASIMAKFQGQAFSVLVLIALFLVPPCFGQEDAGMVTSAPAAPTSVLTLQAAVGTGDSARQSIADLHVVLVGKDAGNQQVMAITDASGKATASVPPGTYRLFTPHAVRRNGDWYTWDMDVSLTRDSEQIQLSELNAITVHENADGTSSTVMIVTPEGDKAGPSPGAPAAAPPQHELASPDAQARPKVRLNAKERRGKSKPLTGYRMVVVKSIRVANSPGTGEVRSADNLLLQSTIVSKLRSSRLFANVQFAGDDSRIESQEHGASEANMLELLGTVISYRRGQRMKRGALGIFGSGVTRMKVQFLFRDMNTGEPVLQVTSEGNGEAGLLWGGDDEENARQAIQHVADKLLTSIRHNRQ